MKNFLWLNLFAQDGKDVAAPLASESYHEKYLFGVILHERKYFNIAVRSQLFQILIQRIVPKGV